MSLSVAQRDECLRHMGYPMMGSPVVQSAGPPYTATFGQAGGLLGFRYFEFYALVVYRLNNMAAEEEVSILGPGSSFFGSFLQAASVQINLTVGTVAAGDSVTAQVNGSPVSYTVQAGDTALTIAQGLAAAILANSQIASVVNATASLVSAGVSKVVVVARTPGFLANSLTLQAYPVGTTFTSVTVTQTGSSTATLTLTGGMDPPGPVWTDPSQSVVQPYYGYLPIIRFWESQITNASSGQDTVKAGPFIQRQDELAARMGGYRTWCKRMCQWFQVPYYGAGTFDQTGPRRRIS